MRTKTHFVLVAIWIGAISLAAVQLYVARSTEFTYNGENLRECSEHWPFPAIGKFPITSFENLRLVIFQKKRKKKQHQVQQI